MAASRSANPRAESTSGTPIRVIAGRIRAPRSMGRSSRTLRQMPKPKPLPDELHSSHFPHHTGHCSLINPVSGTVRKAELATDEERLDRWITASFDRWSALTDMLPADVGPRFPHGYYNFAYQVVGDARQTTLSQLPDVIRTSIVRHSGWPPFWYPTREGITPYPVDGAVECWLGGDTDTPAEKRDSATADFWRITPDGCAYLLRGHQEDSGQLQWAGQGTVAPGTVFDVTLPVWRVGETLLQAERLASNLFEGPTNIRFAAEYTGLQDRSLVSINERRYVSDGLVSRQESISLQTHVESKAIGPNLPEIVHPLLAPLYELFGFFELPMELVANELTRMRA